MKLGAITLIWTGDFGRPDLNLIPRLAGAGFDTIEIVAFQLPGFPAAEVRRSVERHGIGCNFTTAFPAGVGFVFDDAAARARAAAHMRTCIELTAEMGAPVFSGPFYAPIGYLPGRRRTAAEWERVVEGLAAAGGHAAKFGVTLAVEPINRYETYFLNTAADAAELCNRVNLNNVGVLFDFYHANIEEKDIQRAILTLGKHIRNVHASENDRGIPGSGHTDWAAGIGALKQTGFNGSLVIESFGFTIDAIAAATCIWRDLATEPEAIAIEGLRFLRQQLVAAAAA